MNEMDRFRGALLGLAVGDALGTTVEFVPRGTFDPMVTIVGGGPFRLLPGQWTDDTSMALCLATSLVEAGGFDPYDQMDRYLRWYESGYLSSTGFCFDIGATVRAALGRYKQTGDPFSGSTDPLSAGNGSVMRLAPIPVYYFPDNHTCLRFAADSSRTTHGTAECLDACRLFADILCRAFQGADKEDALFGSDPSLFESASIRSIARGNYRQLPAVRVRGSGYVVRSLEAALWSFLHAVSFREAVLTAANFGDDADTTAAICGQVAGAFFGESGIPEEWLNILAMRSEIADLADQLRARKDAA